MNKIVVSLILVTVIGVSLFLLVDNFEQKIAVQYESGYVKGLTDGAGVGYTVRDPSFAEMQKFLQNDLTDQNVYVEDDYVCWRFSSDVKNNAFNSGYRCGLVYIDMPESAHVIVCFNTADRGLVYVEPQSDEVVTLSVGASYWDRENYEVDYDDTILSYLVVW